MASRFITGASMILFVIVVNSLVALIQTDNGTAANVAGCTQIGNTTSNDSYVQCQNTSKTSFLNSLFQVTVGGIQGLPVIINALYITLMGFILVAGIILVVISFVPTLGF